MFRFPFIKRVHMPKPYYIRSDIMSDMDIDVTEWIMIPFEIIYIIKDIGVVENGKKEESKPIWSEVGTGDLQTTPKIEKESTAKKGKMVRC